MKTLYFDCNMGAAGDMIIAALLGVFDNPEEEIKALNFLGIPKVSFQLEQVSRSGIVGNHVKVLIDGETEPDNWQVEEGEGHDHEHHHHHEHSHEHRSLGDVEEIIGSLNVSQKVKEDAISIYRLIADAESKAHGHPVEEVHFHEVGKLDAIADVTAACLLIEKLSPDEIVASPIAVGNGYVKCAHGIMPVPAPATANILTGVPIHRGVIPTESCTPTGAAILKHFVTRFDKDPQITFSKIGYGMGSRVFPGIVSALRVMV